MFEKNICKCSYAKISILLCGNPHLAVSTADRAALKSGGPQTRAIVLVGAQTREIVSEIISEMYSSRVVPPPDAEVER